MIPAMCVTITSLPIPITIIHTLKMQHVYTIRNMVNLCDEEEKTPMTGEGHAACHSSAGPRDYVGNDAKYK